ncbi:MAG: hypothetical protein RMM98_10260 [Acidobacteriota bacterium]|nr:hypothetical protein [Blastocatellia bacterium]MDW8239988.1 hypothetical protein [Acidobacteriota bacterium]
MNYSRAWIEPHDFVIQSPHKRTAEEPIVGQSPRCSGTPRTIKMDHRRERLRHILLILTIRAHEVRRSDVIFRHVLQISAFPLGAGLIGPVPFDARLIGPRLIQPHRDVIPLVLHQGGVTTQIRRIETADKVRVVQVFKCRP